MVFFFLILGPLLSPLFLSQVISQLSLFLEGPDSQIPEYRTKLHSLKVSFGTKIPSLGSFPLSESLLCYVLLLQVPFIGASQINNLFPTLPPRTSSSSSHPYPGQGWRWAHGGLECDGDPSAVGERPA